MAEHLYVTSPSDEFVEVDDRFVADEIPAVAFGSWTLAGANEDAEPEGEIAALSVESTSGPFSSVTLCPLPIAAARTRLAVQAQTR